jgi:alkylation response protein AidB-like acyl-CoA dehydrogenase
MATQLKVDAEAKPRETLTERIKPYLAEIASRAAATEEARMVSVENIDIIRKVGFVRALLPANMGGDERDLWDYCDGIRTLVKACPSTGWVTGVLNIHPPGLLHYSKKVQNEVWATGVDTIISSSGTPVMKGKFVDGGILVNGRGQWSSGCDHAEWAMVGIKVPNMGDPQYPERNYAQYLFMAHRSEFTIDQNSWFSKGMRGSGSKDLIFDNLVVPMYRMERLEALNFGFASGDGGNDSWIARIPFSVVFPTFLPAIALGCADGMIEEFTKRQRSRKNYLTGAWGITNPAGHMRLAESIHERDSLSIFYKDILERMQKLGRDGHRPGETEFFEYQAKLNFVTARATDVIDRLFKGAGASAIADFSPMQRYWRDGHAARLHLGSDYDSSLQYHGRSVIGVPMSPDV